MQESVRTNGLNRSPSASSSLEPGGLAQASQAAGSTAAMEATTRAVKEAMSGIRSGREAGSS